MLNVLLNAVLNIFLGKLPRACWCVWKSLLGYWVCCVNNHISVMLKESFDAMMMFHVAATMNDVQ